MRNKLPLANVRVLDFCWIWAGPAMTAVLADMGAEVIKVESRSRPDGTRLGRPVIGDRVAAGDRGEEPELQPLNHGLNRNKRSITVNLTQPEGIALLKRLVRICDVVTDNFSVGVMQRHGLDYEQLREVNQSIICLSLSGPGQTGPLRDIVTLAHSVTSLAGLSTLIGYPGEPPLGRLQPPFGDTNASLHGVFAILTALWHRTRTGKGQYVDLSQWEAAVCGMEEAIVDYQVTGSLNQSIGNAHRWLAPHGNYPCLGEDRWVSIAVGGDQEWASLCAALGHPVWCHDPRFASSEGRLAHRDELDELLAAWTRERTPEDASALLQAHGVAAMTVMNIEDQFLDQHFRERQLHWEVEHPIVGSELIYGIPFRLSKTPGSVRSSGPLLGQDNDYVFKELLGLKEEEIAALTSCGAIE